MTKEVLGRLPVHVAMRIESFRIDYKNPGLNRAETRKTFYGYTFGLMDAGLITERERQILYVYCTV